MKSVIIYCRVSTRPQEEKGLSLEGQERECLEKASQMGFTPLEVVRETHTGMELWDRLKLTEIRRQFKTGKFRALLCHDIDRLSRRAVHQLIIAEEAQDAGIDLLFVLTPPDDSREGQLLRYVKGYAAEIEHEKIKERTLRGKLEKARRGKGFTGGHELFGYRWNKEEGKRYTYGPEAELVRRIFRQYLRERIGMAVLAHKLNLEGVPSPRGAQWSGTTIRGILSHPAYKGEDKAWRWKKVPKIGKGQKKYLTSVLRESENESIPLPSVSPPIVSRGEWESVHEIMLSNCGDRTRNISRQFLLRGAVWCAGCDRRMYTNSNSHSRSYRCGSRDNYGSWCGSREVNAAKLEEWVWKEVSAFMENPEVVLEEIKRRESNSHSSQLSEDLKIVNRRLDKIEKGQQALLHRFRSQFDLPGLAEMIEREIAQAEREKQSLVQTKSELESRLKSHHQFHSNLKDLLAFCSQVREKLSLFTFEEKRKTLEALGIRIKAKGQEWELGASLSTFVVVTSPSKRSIQNYALAHHG